MIVLHKNRIDNEENCYVTSAKLEIKWMSILFLKHGNLFLLPYWWNLQQLETDQRHEVGFFFFLKDWCRCFPKPRETNRLRITEVNGAHVEIAIFLHFSVHAFVLRRQTTKKRTRSFFLRTDVDVSQRQGKQIGWGLQK